MEKRIGRLADNDIVIDKPDVSRSHARVVQVSPGLFMVEDLESSYGTFINGYRVHKAKMSLNDVLTLSGAEGHVVNLRSAFGNGGSARKQSYPANGLSDEFNSLSEVWNSYRLEVKKIRNKHQFNNGLIRLAFVLPAIVGGYIISAQSSDNRYHIASAVISSLATTVGMLVSASSGLEEELMSVEDDFFIRYICPHCKKHFGKRQWDTLARMEKCGNCGKSFRK